MQIYINLKQNHILILACRQFKFINSLILTNIASMKQIRAKVHELTASGTKLSFENTITYLLDIVDILMAEPSPLKAKAQLRQSQSNARSQSTGKNKQLKLQAPQEQHFDEDTEQYNERNMVMAQMKQSKLSFVQELNNRIVQRKKEQRKPVQSKKKYKFNRRGLQECIQIYHQSLFESIEIIKVQHEKILELMSLTPKRLHKLEQFCQKYQSMKKQCKTFDDIIKITHQVLAKQLLTVLYPPRAITDPNKYMNKPKNYLLYFQQ